MSKKQFVLIMTDTQRLDMVSCYQDVGIKTPNIDALAADKEGSGWNVLERLDGLFIRPGALDQLPTGAIVGKAILTRCNPITEDFRAKLSPQELDLGDFSIGRYAWEFHVMIPVDPPVKASGKQGLWTWEGSLE